MEQESIRARKRFELVKSYLRGGRSYSWEIITEHLDALYGPGES